MRVYTGIVAILIESALPLSIFGIIEGILMRLAASGGNLSEAFLGSYYFFAGLFYAFCVGSSLHISQP